MYEKAKGLRDRLDDSVEARFQMQTHLDGLIDIILMDPTDRTATVVMFDGLVNFKLDKAGKLIGEANATATLDDTMRAHIVGDDPARDEKLDQVLQHTKDAL